MSVYAPPDDMSVHEALHSIFSHYCKALKSVNKPNQKNESLSMDGKSFLKLCHEAPDLGSHIGRTDVDLIFSRSKPLGTRRLSYEHFLDALLQLAIRIYPDMEPVKALTYVLSNFIFGVFDQTSAENEEMVLESIYNELNLN